MKTLLTWALPLTLLLGLGAAVGFGVSPSLVEGQAYRAALPPAAVDLLDLQDRAQGLGWWVRVQEGQTVRYFQGARACEACVPAQEDLFFSLPQLLLDAGRFMIRLDAEDYRLNVRPDAQNPGNVELTLVMRATRAEALVVAQLGELLDRLGLQTGPLSFAQIPLDKKARAPLPEGLALEENLFRLIQAPDWPDFAALRGIPLSGLRARVLVELADEAVLPQGEDLSIESRAGTTLRAQVLIDELLSLGRDPAVRAVRVPAQPQPGGN